MSEWRMVAYPYNGYLINLRTFVVKPKPTIRLYGNRDRPKTLRPRALSKTPEGKYKLKDSVHGKWRQFHPTTIYDVTTNRLESWPENRQG